MELKCEIFGIADNVISCFNRTFMELKLNAVRYFNLKHQVLIVPLWN